jgi:hypothetical protein
MIHVIKVVGTYANTCNIHVAMCTFGKLKARYLWQN